LIVTRLLMGFVAIAAISASVAVAVFASAFALFALVQPYVGSAGGGAVVAGAFALIALIVGLIAMPRRKRRRAEGPSGVAEDLMDLVRDKPLAAAGVALAAGVMAMRNPRVITEVARAFFGERNRKRRKDQRD
jgi:hypothetical protein